MQRHVNHLSLNVAKVLTLVIALFGIGGGGLKALSSSVTQRVNAAAKPAVQWQVRLASLTTTGQIASLPAAIVTAWTPDGHITLQNKGKATELDIAALLSMRRLEDGSDSVPASMPSELWWLYLRTGDIFSGQPMKTTDGKLAFNSDVFGKIKVPLDDVEELSRDVRSGHRKNLSSDQLVFTNGDNLRGTMLAFSSGGAKWKSALGILTIPTARISAIKLAPTILPPSPRGPQIRITCDDGTVLITPCLAWDGTQLKAYPASIAALHCESRDVRHIEVLNGQLIWLSSLRPAGYSQNSYLGSSWPMKKNKNCMGGVLRAGNKTYRHGLGLHLPVTLTYHLHGRYATLMFIPAMDQSARPWGAGRIRVTADGKAIFASGILTPGGALQPAVVKVAGANTLQFKIAGTNEYGIRGRVDLLDAVLLK